MLINMLPTNPHEMWVDARKTSKAEFTNRVKDFFQKPTRKNDAVDELELFNTDNHIQKPSIIKLFYIPAAPNLSLYVYVYCILRSLIS